MSTQILCDRCGAPGGAISVTSTARTLVVPAADPATAVVAADVEISIGLQAPQDLCPACLASALLEYALTHLAPGLSPAVSAAFLGRLQAALAPKADA